MSTLEQSSESPASKFVAIVDDDDMLLEALVALVRSMTHEVQGFRSAAIFFSSVSIDDVGCVISDVNMAEIDGLAFQQILLERAPWLPLIFITAMPNPTLSVLARQAGARAVLAKPVDEAKLQWHLLEALGPSGESSEALSNADIV